MISVQIFILTYPFIYLLLSMIDGHSNIHSYVSIHLSTRNKLSISHHFISFAKKII